MKFEKLSEYFKKIEETPSRLAMTEILADLFETIESDEIDKVLYLLQGRVAPPYEKVDFGFAERMLIKAITSGFHIERNYFIREYKRLGDMGKAVYESRKKISSLHRRTLSVSEVFTILEKLARSGGEGSQEAKIGYLIDLLINLDPLSCCFLVRIPTRTMRLGFSDMTILDAFSWMLKKDKSLRPEIEKAYHVRPDLGYIGKVLKTKGIQGLSHIAPAVFTPILMMRAERLSNAPEIIEKLQTCLVEPKFDGFRLQCHYKKEKGKSVIKLFSRNLDEVTYMYPDVVTGIQKQITAREAIFEGEAIGVDLKTGAFLPFQETVQRKRKYGIEEKVKSIPLKLMVFDILYKDGENLLMVPFEKRRAIVNSLFTIHNKKTDTVLAVQDERIDSPQRLEKLFEESVAKGLEGIIAKKLTGVYQAGARGFNWIKYKKSYSSRLQDTIDCLVMGYDYGRGKRTSFGIGAFLVGVLNGKRDEYVTVAKIGTGLTDEEWKSLRQKIDAHHLTKKAMPAGYTVHKAMECDVWVKPALVVEIRADEITKSPVHTARLALRFPRLERFRNDKRPEEATTIRELEHMFNKQKKE